MKKIKIKEFWNNGIVEARSYDEHNRLICVIERSTGKLLEEYKYHSDTNILSKSFIDRDYSKEHIVSYYNEGNRQYDFYEVTRDNSEVVYLYSEVYDKKHRLVRSFSDSYVQRYEYNSNGYVAKTITKDYIEIETKGKDTRTVVRDGKVIIFETYNTHGNIKMAYNYHDEYTDTTEYIYVASGRLVKIKTKEALGESNLEEFKYDSDNIISSHYINGSLVFYPIIDVKYTESKKCNVVLVPYDDKLYKLPDYEYINITDFSKINGYMSVEKYKELYGSLSFRISDARRRLRDMNLEYIRKYVYTNRIKDITTDDLVLYYEFGADKLREDINIFKVLSPIVPSIFNERYMLVNVICTYSSNNLFTVNEHFQLPITD